MGDLSRWLRPSAESYFFKIVLALLTAYLAIGTLASVVRWRDFRGDEAARIGQALASGHGYSFDGLHRWLFEPGSPDQYFPSAWSDPLFPGLYAAMVFLFGEWGRLLMVLLSLACFVVAAALAAMTAKRIAGPGDGLITLVFLLVSVRGTAIGLSPWPLASLWITLLLFYFVKHAEHLNLRAVAILGMLLGLSVLTSSSTMIFAPVLVLLVFAFAPTASRAGKLSAVMVLIAALLVTPWTLRNYLVFDEFVPVRNGAGILAYIGTVGLGKTFAPDSAATPLPAPWTSSGPFAAVEGIVEGPPANRRTFEQQWRTQVMAARLGPELDGLNEAQRDKWLLREARDFVLANPLLTAQLAVAKLTHFLRHSRLPPSVAAPITACAILVCLALAFRRRLLVAPLLLTLAYMAPFAILTPYFARYRYPIEPVIAVLVGVAVAYVAEAISRKIEPGFASWRRNELS